MPTVISSNWPSDDRKLEREREEHIRAIQEKWSDAARAAAAAGRRSRGSGINARKERARTAFVQAGGKPTGLKHYRAAGVGKDYLRDRRGREFTKELKTGKMYANRIRAKQAKGSRAAANRRKAQRSVLRPWD